MAVVVAVVVNKPAHRGSFRGTAETFDPVRENRRASRSAMDVLSMLRP
jgi:hypothetical protein